MLRQVGKDKVSREVDSHCADLGPTAGVLRNKCKVFSSQCKEESINLYVIHIVSYMIRIK